jgi:hypothetical protein
VFSLQQQQRLIVLFLSMRTLLNTILTIDSNTYKMNKDKCFRIFEEFIPLVSPRELISFVATATIHLLLVLVSCPNS